MLFIQIRMLVSIFKIQNKNNQSKEVVDSGKPGQIIDNKFTIACSKNAIQILELKKKQKEMTTEEFLRGHDIKISQNL